MGNRNKSIVYFLLGLYTAMVSWFYYHSIFWLLVNWIFWPISLLYFILTGHLSHGQWLSIPKHFLG
jgi:hypothetical protein